MGILDDAIREHLDLKRKHGVSEQELQRQEEEALGPVRREVAAAETGDGSAAAPAPQPEVAQEPAAPEAQAEVSAKPSADAPSTEPPPAATPDEAPLEEPAPVPEPPEVAEEQPLEPEADLSAAEPAIEEPAPAELGDTPPRGFEAVDPNDAPDAEEDQQSDDMLEDTPDFLQETPEHDRLWFEQKPPRDFDFD
jgi:hypothetical protein